MKKVILIFTALFFTISSLYSQESAQTGKEEEKESNKVKYDLTLSFQQKVYYVYRVTVDTKVERNYNDGSKNEYEKTHTYWFTMFASREKDSKGFQEVEVRTDSLDYKFEMGDKKVEYNTAKDYDKMMPLNFNDYMATFMPMSKEFNFLYSPYGEVANISGEMLEEKREEHSQIKDESKREIVLRSISDENLKFYFDVSKGIYPNFSVEADTNWTSNLNLILADITYNGDVKHKFKGLTGREYIIESEIDSIEVRPGKLHLLDIGQEANINRGTASGSMSTEMYTGGIVKYMRADLKAKAEGKVKNLEFEQNIETTLTWDLTARLQFK